MTRSPWRDVSETHTGSSGAVVAAPTADLHCQTERSPLQHAAFIGGHGRFDFRAGGAEEVTRHGVFEGLGR